MTPENRRHLIGNRDMAARYLIGAAVWRLMIATDRNQRARMLQRWRADMRGAMNCRLLARRSPMWG